MSKAENHDHLFWVLVAVVVLFTGIITGFASADIAKKKNTPEAHGLYQNDAAVQLPVMFTLNHDLVSDRTDMVGYCLTVSNRDVECYTMKGRFLGVGSVELYSDGNPTTTVVLDKAPEQYRRVMTNAFLRVWG